MSNQINLIKLEKGTGSEFIQELAGVPRNLDENNVKDFYQALSTLFQKKTIPETSTVRLLRALYKVISDGNDAFNKVYVDNNYIVDLPFNSKSKSVQSQILNVLYAISTYVPAAIDSTVSEKINHYYVKEYPKKILTIIGIYGRQFDDIDDPYPLLDLLLKGHSSYFRKDMECCQDYVSLLVYMCQEFKGYCDRRIQYCWNSVCQALNTENEPTLTICYNALCKLYELDTETVSRLSFPLFACSIHLRNKNVVSHSVLSLLFRYQPNFDYTEDDDDQSIRPKSPTSPKNTVQSNMMDLIQSLIIVSQTDANANLILVKLAMNENISRLLLHDATWMAKNLPGKIDTMRLFAVVLSHEDLRDELIKKTEVIDFLRDICSLDTSSVLTAICIFIRRFPMDKEYVEKLSRYDFLSQFFSTAFQHDDETTLHAALVMADTISKICYVRELFVISDKIADLAKGDDELALTAGKVAVELCRYPKCAMRFKRRKLDEYYMGKMKNHDSRKIAVHFLKAFKAVQSELDDQKTDKRVPNSANSVRVRRTNYKNSSESDDGGRFSPLNTPKLMK